MDQMYGLCVAVGVAMLTFPMIHAAPSPRHPATSSAHGADQKDIEMQNLLYSLRRLRKAYRKVHVKATNCLDTDLTDMLFSCDPDLYSQLHVYRQVFHSLQDYYHNHHTSARFCQRNRNRGRLCRRLRETTKAISHYLQKYPKASLQSAKAEENSVLNYLSEHCSVDGVDTLGPRMAQHLRMCLQTEECQRKKKGCGKKAGRKGKKKARRNRGGGGLEEK